MTNRMKIGALIMFNLSIMTMIGFMFLNAAFPTTPEQDAIAEQNEKRAEVRAEYYEKLLNEK